MHGDAWIGWGPIEVVAALALIAGLLARGLGRDSGCLAGGEGSDDDLDIVRDSGLPVLSVYICYVGRGRLGLHNAFARLAKES